MQEQSVSPRRRPAWLPSVGVLLLASLAFLTNLGGGKLFDDDEPKNAACGVEMLQNGNYVVPMFNAELRAHKPVMLYWAMIASYSSLGVNELAARLPSALASVISVLLCYHLGRMLFDRSTGLLGAALLTSGVMFNALARAATPDGLLICFCLSALTLYVAGIRKARGGVFAKDESRAMLPIGYAMGMYLAIALAVLTKGPIGLLLPMSSIVLFAIFNAAETPKSTGWRSLFARLTPARMITLAQDLRLASGLAIVTLGCLPWYVAVSMATEGAWVTGFLGTHNVHRFLSPMEGHRGPFFYHVISVNLGMFPATCFLPIAMVAAIRHTARSEDRSQPHALLLSWAGVWVVFFSIAATKLPNYVAPSYPAFALLIAAWLMAVARGVAANPAWLRVGLGLFTAVGVAVVGGLIFTAGRVFDGDYAVVAFGLAPAVGGGVALWLALDRQRAQQAVGVFAVAAVAFTVGAAAFLAPRVSAIQASPQVAAAILDVEAASRDEALAVTTFRYTKPNLVFYLNRPTEPLDDAKQLAEQLREPNRVVVIPRDALEEIRGELPAGIVELSNTPRFFRRGEEVVVIAGGDSVASRAVDTPLLR
ncbi:MAG: glycosyltransferase family 39 protein [Planctomycetota bacterium]